MWCPVQYECLCEREVWICVVIMEERCIHKPDYHFHSRHAHTLHITHDTTRDCTVQNQTRMSLSLSRPTASCNQLHALPRDDCCCSSSTSTFDGVRCIVCGASPSSSAPSPCFARAATISALLRLALGGVGRPFSVSLISDSLAEGVSTPGLCGLRGSAAFALSLALSHRVASLSSSCAGVGEGSRTALSALLRSILDSEARIG